MNCLEVEKGLMCCLCLSCACCRTFCFFHFGIPWKTRAGEVVGGNATNEKLGWEKVALESIDPNRRKGVFDFLYLSQEPLHDVRIFESHSEGTLKIRGQEMEKFLVKNRDNKYWFP